MTRGGRTKDRTEAERKCIVTGEVQPKAGLIRFVIGPDNTVVPDVLGKLPGRGMYVSSTKSALDAAGRGEFSRSAKATVTVPDDLAETVEALMTKRVIDLIAMARKAGLAVCGFEKVKGWLAGGERVRVLLQAGDGSERGKAKLWTPEGARYFGCLSAQELGLAFGRGSVIHGALAAGGLSDRVVEDATKLRGLREMNGGDTPAEKDKEAL